MTRRCFATTWLGICVASLVRAQDDQDIVVVPPNPLEKPSGPVWLESLFKAPGVRYDGNLVFSPRRSTINGQIFEHAMTVDVKDDPMGPGETCGMSIPVNGQFLRFEATVGRDDKETASGTGFCYFEIYGDSKLLFRSDALRSRKFRVLTNEGGAKRDRPQEISVDIKGMRLLRLLVRYANDFKQLGSYDENGLPYPVRRAAGCIWGDARLIPGEGATLDTEKLTERDERIRTAARLAARTLKRQLRFVVGARASFKVAILPIRDQNRVSADDLLMRPQIARVFFAGESADGPALGEPLEGSAQNALRNKLVAFHPKSVRAIAEACEEARYAGARYLIGGYIESERLYLLAFDTRPDGGDLVANATGWLSPP